jgi:hypothetical protein
MGLLCLQLGLTLRQYYELSSAEIAYWRAYYRFSPFGEDRADLRTARMMHMYAEAHRDLKKSSKTSVKDFLPKFEQQQRHGPRAVQERRHTFSPEAFLEKLKSVFAPLRSKE